MNFNNTLFDGNTADLVSNGFQMINSEVVIQNSIIQNSNNNETETGFFNLMIQSNLQILDNSVIRNVSGQIYGLLLAVTESNISISNNVSITNCNSFSSGPTIMIFSSPNFTISDTYISEITPSVINCR